jgi:uracil-DNA glycosylase
VPTHRDDLVAHLRFLADLGVRGFSRDAAWRDRADTAGRAGGTGASRAETDASPAQVGTAPMATGTDVAAAPAASGAPGRLARSAAEALAALREDIGDCTRCTLHRGRTHLVFGVGNPETPLMFVGEGPGAEEDQQGIPFVGRAGQLLTQIITAMGYERDQVYIANVVKCRPPENRNPEPDEIASCEPFLHHQIEVIRPRVIVALGKFAAQTLLRTTESISRLRGRFHRLGAAEVMPTFHPSYLLRNPAAKREVWDDMKQVMAKLRSSER